VELKCPKKKEVVVSCAERQPALRGPGQIPTFGPAQGEKREGGEPSRGGVSAGGGKKNTVVPLGGGDPSHPKTFNRVETSVGKKIHRHLFPGCKEPEGQAKSPPENDGEGEGSK